MSYDRLQWVRAACETLDLSAAPGSSVTHLLVTAGDALLLEHLVARFVSSATVGNRTVALQILDGGDNVLAQMAGDVNQAASLTRSYVFTRAAPADAAFVSGVLQRPTHLYRLEPTWKIKVADLANIDAAADSVRVLATVRRIRSNV